MTRTLALLLITACDPVPLDGKTFTPTEDTATTTVPTPPTTDDSDTVLAVEDCFDGHDNDGDGRTDCTDDDCADAEHHVTTNQIGGSLPRSATQPSHPPGVNRTSQGPPGDPPPSTSHPPAWCRPHLAGSPRHPSPGSVCMALPHFVAQRPKFPPKA